MSYIKKSSIEELEKIMDIYEVVDHYLELKRAGANFKAPCPFHDEKSPSLVVSPSKQIYHCFGCGAGGNAIKFVKEYEKIDFKEAVEKVASISKFTLQYEDNIARTPQRTFQKKKRQAPVKINYLTFHADKIKEADITAEEAKYDSLKDVQKMMLVYSDIWSFAKKNVNSKAKYGFGKERHLNLQHIEFQKLGYIPVKQFWELDNMLKEKYPLNDLVLFGIINNAEHKKPFSFKLHYIEKGGVLVYPSFHVYVSNLVTGFMFRPTHPPQWMIESKFKEIQMTNRNILDSLPYGFTNEFIQNNNAIKCIVEGGPDAHSSPEKINGKDLLFVALPGTNGLKEEHLGYLRGQTLRFMLDPDKGGQRAFFGTIKLTEKQSGLEHSFLRDKAGMKDCQAVKEKLKKEKNYYNLTIEDGYLQKCRKANICVEAALWDPIYGDLNDVKKSIDVNGIPCKDMEDFYLNVVVVKRWCIDEKDKR